MIGAHLAGWDVITGIEQSPEYTAIGNERLKWWQGFSTYASAAALYDDEDSQHEAGVTQGKLWE